MGEVYLGEKIGPEGFVKPVVLKCVLPQLARDRAFVQLFLDEARLAALLNHPNIAQVYDFGLVDDVYYIAMEYVPGYTVDDIRRKLRSINTFMPLEHIACIASQVCQGLHYAHTLTDANGLGLGLVHRDVSPHNLIVSIDGGVKLVDFGIAKARAGLTRVQAKGAVGKFGYMSPEQSRGEVVDGRSDVFSLGVCLWELVSNERLHDPKLDRAPDYNPKNPVRSVTELRREVPRQFEAIIETALAIQAEDRYPNSHEMHLALERFQAAMTHYAGQSALARYIKDLVEGKVENPGNAVTGSVVEPKSSAGPRQERRSGAYGSEALEGAQRYEEVFGVSVDDKRPRGRRAVPKSWETTKRPPGEAAEGGTPPRAANTGARLLDLKTGNVASAGGEGELELARTEVPARSVRSSRAASIAPRTGGRGLARLLGVLVLLGVLGGLGAGVYLNQDKLEALIRGPEKKPGPALTSVYRVISDPPGATVLLDERAQDGVTPLDVQLIPDVEYRIAVKLPKHATKVAVVKASVGTEVRPIQFKLDRAGTLRITTDPPGAALWLDGRPLADLVTPATLDDVPAGQTVKVTAEIKGLPPQSKTITLRPGQKRALHIPLDHAPREGRGGERGAPRPEPEPEDPGEGEPDPAEGEGT